jgi:hypothetical protein
MKRCLWIILLLPGLPLFARDKKLGGYVLDPPAFQKIQTYCVDTHNLGPREVTVIDQFISREGKSSGLLARLPWQRLATCKAPRPDALVRLEFPADRYAGVFNRRAINGVLLVFRPGSPTPVYETREVLMTDTFEGSSEGFDKQVLEHDALYYVVRILAHDWQLVSGTLSAQASGGGGE